MVRNRATQPKLSPAQPVSRPAVRIDKWLFQARFCKSRSLATQIVETGNCRVNGNRITKASHPVGAGDTLTVLVGDRVRLIRILAVGLRRCPAGEAVALYLDLDQPLPVASSPLE